MENIIIYNFNFFIIKLLILPIYLEQKTLHLKRKIMFFAFMQSLKIIQKEI